MCDTPPVYVRTADIPHLSYRAREGFGENFYCSIPNEVPHEIHESFKDGITVKWKDNSRPVITYASEPPDKEPEPGSWGPDNMNYDPPEAD